MYVPTVAVMVWSGSTAQYPGSNVQLMTSELLVAFEENRETLRGEGERVKR